MKKATKPFIQSKLETKCVINTKSDKNNGSNNNYDENSRINGNDDEHPYTSNKGKDNKDCIINISKQFYSWNFGTVNIRSGKEKSEGSKMYMITKQVAEAKLSFCCLQEVRYRNIGRKIISLNTGEKYVFLWCGQKRRRDAGVGILIKQCDDITFEDPDIMDPRLMAINIQVKGFSIRLINVYAPTNCNGSDNQKDIFYRMTKKACTKNLKHQKVIVTGDFNATSSISLKQCCFDGRQIIDDNICNDNGSRLKSLCRELQLCMTQTYFDHPLEDRYTWYSANKITKKVIDYVLMEPYVLQYVKDCAVEKNNDFESDHRLIKTEMHTPTTKRARKKQNKLRFAQKPDPKSLENEELKNSFLQKVKEDFQRRRCLGESISETTIVTSLESAAEATLAKTKRNKPTKEIWKEDIELNELLSQRIQTSKDSVEYKCITKKIKKQVRRLRNEKISNEAKMINDFATRRKVEELFCAFKSDNSTFKDAKPSKKCDPIKLRDYFKIHFTGKTVEEDPIELEEVPEYIENLQKITTQEINIGPPDENELRDVIKNLKCGKASSDIPITYIKHSMCITEFVEEMVKLYQTIWLTWAIPKSWGHSKLVTLWKGPTKGKVDDPTTYRGLQIGSTLCKIIIVIIINRLKSWYEKQLLDQQQGFRSARGTTDGIFFAKSVQQITSKMKKPTYVLFVDLSAAFDHVERSWLFKTIRNRFSDDTDPTLLKLLESLYSSTTTALAETPNDKFELTVGVRQGGPESPMLYNLFMDFVMRIYLDKCKDERIRFLQLKYKIPESASTTNLTAAGDMTIDWSGYADDLMLFFEDEDSLRCGIDILAATFKRYRLSINHSKTKTMILNQQYEIRDYPPTISSLGDKQLENVRKYRYLGCEIEYNKPAIGEAELQLRRDAAECKFYSLAKNLMNMKINLKTRTDILNSLVRSRVVYACQVWNITKAQLQRLNAMYMTCIRKMTKGGYKRKPDSWSFVHTNDDLLRMSKTISLESFVHNQQRNYVAHIIRKDNCSIVKRLLFNNDCSLKPGPQPTLLTSVTKTEGCTLEELINKAKERKI